MLFAVGFIFTFLLGGLTGVLLATAPIDFAVTDTYFVVAHMHYVLFGGSVFALFAGIYYWFPKVTGRMLGEGLGKVHFWMTFVGFHLTFAIQHVLGLRGMPRRVPDYLDAYGFAWMNLLSSIGAALLGASTLPFLWNAWRRWRHGALAGDDPWGGHTLEWATSSPPPTQQLRRPAPADPVEPAGLGPRPSRPRQGNPLMSGTEPDRHELLVETRIFVGIGVVLAVMAAIYVATAYEDAGSVMLAVAAVLAFVCGGYLFVQLRAAGRPDDHAAARLQPAVPPARQHLAVLDRGGGVPHHERPDPGDLVPRARRGRARGRRGRLHPPVPRPLLTLARTTAGRQVG